jgi:predicted aspartyl protease
MSVEHEKMGKAIVSAKVENVQDLFEANQGRRATTDIRTVAVEEALVDTGATYLSLPKRLIQQLALQPLRTRKARTSAGVIDVNVFGAVRLTVQGRDCLSEVAELPDECPAFIGQLPLEALDFVVDPVGQRLLGNPDHGGEHTFDLFIVR